MSEHSEPEEYPFKSPPDSENGIELFLYRKKREGGTPVLLLHGASARHETFEIPKSWSLMDYLYNNGFEPWLLDWRGSGKVVDHAKENGTLESQRKFFDFDYAAKCDIPGALREIQNVRGDVEIAAVGHCLGAGTLAQALAGGDVTKDKNHLTHVVLLTLGLFYESPLDSRLKTQDHVLERLLAEPRPVPAVDPRVREEWPDELEEMYQNWPNPLRPHREEKPPPVHEMCDRLSFMYGTPYFERNLVREIHHSGTWTIAFRSGQSEPRPGETITGDVSHATGILDKLNLVPDSDSWKENAVGELVLIKVSGTFERDEDLKVGNRLIARSTSPAIEGELPRQFGAIPLRMYVHGARNVRRGWAARYDKENDNVDLLQPECRERFDRLERVTLITGAKNQLWHRDSIDRMYEWLTRGSPRDKHQKHIIPDYGHQDLLWGKDAREDVFPRILEGLPEPKKRKRKPDRNEWTQTRIAR